MPNGDGPWTKYQSTPADATQGPWTKYAAGAPTSTTPSTTATGYPSMVQTTEGDLPFDVAQRHARAGYRPGTRPDERAGWEKTLDWARGTGVGRVAGAAGEEAVGIGKGLGYVGSALREDTLETEKYGPGWVMLKRLFAEPAAAKFASTKAAFKSGDPMKGMLGAAATINPFAPDVTNLYALSKSGETSEAIGHGSMDIFALAATDAKIRQHLTAMAKLAESQPTINQGYVGLSKSVQTAATVAEDNITGRTGAIGRHANRVIEQSALDAKMKSLPGEVPTAEVQRVGRAQADTVKRLDSVSSYPPWYTLAEAKDQLTKLGKQASKFDRASKTGTSPEGSVSWAEYDALRKATQDRAAALGPEFAKSWKYYSGEFHNWMQAKKGLIGDFLDANSEPEHLAAMKRLTGGEGKPLRPEVSKASADVPRMKEWLKIYGADPKIVEAAVEQGQALDGLTKQSKNFFVSKFRGLVNHPLLAGVPGITAGGLAAASGIPLAHFVVPLIVIGRISGLLDAADAAKIVRDVAKRVGPESMHAIPGPQGEPPLPELGKFGGAAPGVPEAPEPYIGPERRVTEGEPPDEFERRTRGGAVRGTSMQQDVEAAEAKTKADAEAKRTEWEQQQELAQKLKGARKDRSVYKGKR